MTHPMHLLRLVFGRVAATVFLACAVGSFSSADATVYDLKADWSDTANGSGVWSYNDGSGAIPNHHDNYLPGSFPISQPAWAYAATGPGHIISWLKSANEVSADWKVGDVMTHSWDSANGGASTPHSNVTWTSPIAATIDIRGSVWLTRNIGRAVDWSLSVNGLAVSGGSLFDGDAFDRANPFDLAAGSGGSGALENIRVAAGDRVALTFITRSASGEFVGVNLTIATQFMAGDNFDSAVKDIAKWGPDRVRGTGTFTVSDGVLRFSSSAANSDDDIEWPWLVGDGPFHSSWSVQMDVNMPVIPLTPGFTAVGMGIGVQNSADADDSFAMFIENIWGNTAQELNYYNRQRTNGSTTENSAPANSNSVALRVSWDAATRRLSAWYDPDGRVGGYRWTRHHDFDPMGSWALTGAETFRFFVRGYSEETILSVSQNVYGDNFYVSDESLPRLNIARNGGTVILTWPAAAGSFSVQTATALPGGWGPAGGTITVVGDEHRADIAEDGATRFYQLNRN